jgi:2-amino-4-hydroxy-6-hydroxymethyldihydropteridine diphosphokinase
MIFNNYNVFIGLGSNLDNPYAQIISALNKIKRIRKINFIRISSMYSSPPYGFKKQDNFVNAVVKIQSSLNPFDLLKIFNQIEKDQKRVKHFKNGPRTIDLDILLFGNITINTDRLKIPHPEITNRPFVIKPLCEISPNIKSPNGKILSENVNFSLTDSKQVRKICNAN